MTGFVIAAIVLLVMALAAVLRPLIAGAGTGATPDDGMAKRIAALDAARDAGVIDADEYATKRAALAATAESATTTVTSVPPPRRGLALVLAAIVPASAFLLYWTVGEPRALNPANLVRNETAAATDPAANAPEMDAAITSLAARLEESPDDIDGWLLLGRAYKATGKYAQAQEAMQRAYDLAPDNIDVTTEYAEALAMNSPERRITGRSLELLQDALRRDPTHQRALWLTGAAAAQDGRYADAAQAWETLLAQIPPDSDIATTLREQIGRARERAGMPPLADAPALATAPAAAAPSAPTAPAMGAANAPAATSATPTASATPSATPDQPAAASGGASLTVTIALDPKLAARVSPGDVLFVFARLPAGPRMPLAIQRLPAAQLPITLTLDDSMAMMPAMNLSSAPQVVVGARISKTGEATPQPGDLQGLSPTIDVKSQSGPVTITIADVLP